MGDDGPLVFINYRGSDEPSAAMLLDTELAAVFGRARVFLDHRSIGLGADYPSTLLDTVRRCAVLLVVIGHGWFASGRAGRRLIDDPEDWVRRELLEALEHDVPIVPVLIGDARMPAAEDLPPELAPVARRQYAAIRHRHQPQDIAHLVTSLTTEFPRLRARARVPQAAPARIVVSVTTLKPDPMAADAACAIDWTERFDGDSAYTKRRPLPPSTWAQLQAEIESLPRRLPPDAGAVLVTGSLRQATAFTVGAALRQVAGFDLAIHQGRQLWSSDTPYSSPCQLTQSEFAVGQGDDLAVLAGVAAAPTGDVLEFARSLPVRRLLVLSPVTGARDDAVADAAAAMSLAVGIRDAIRAACRAHPRVHLFLSGPMGLALLLGHRWNRVRPTLVYEDVKLSPCYEHAFSVDA